MRRYSSQFLLCLLLLAPTGASALEEDSGAWVAASVKHRLDDRWTASLFTQLRLYRDFSSVDRSVLRPYLDYRASDHLTLSGGYDLHLVGYPVSKLEQRLWQQGLVQWHTGDLTLKGRMRMEQRFVEHAHGTGLRLRLLAGASRPFAGGDWYAVITNEVSVALNQRGAPRRGFDKNHLYLGVGTDLAPGTRVEFGYQMQYAVRPGRDRVLHLLMFSLQFY